MKNLIILALVSISMAAFAKDKQVQKVASDVVLPPVDYHIPTKTELVDDFAQGFKGHLDHAQEYWGNQPELLKEEIRLNTVTTEDVEMVAGWAADFLQRQYEVCQKLNAQYPKTQVPGVNCVTSVLMVNGLGHPNDLRQLIEILSDKEKTKKLKEGVAGKDNQDQAKWSLKTLKKGIDHKSQFLDSREVQTIEQALGFQSLSTALNEKIDATLAK